jgi:hypothetical protein
MISVQDVQDVAAATTGSVGALPWAAGLAVAVVHLLQVAKQSKLVPFIDAHSDHITKLVTVLTAIATSVGISFVFTQTPEGVGSLTIGGLPTTAVGWVTVVLQTFASYGGQKFYYHAAVKPNTTGKGGVSGF